MNILIRLKIYQAIIKTNLLGIFFTLLTILSISLHLLLINFFYVKLIDSWPFLILDVVLLVTTFHLLIQKIKWKKLFSFY